MGLARKLKPLYYRLTDTRLTGVRLTLGYVFHTEWVWDDEAYARLRAFAKAFRGLTTKRPICCVMAGCNPRIAASLRDSGLDPAEYAERVRSLTEVVDLGYHGHFWVDPREGDHPINYLLHHNFVRSRLQEPLERDLAWFDAEGINHNGLYTGGWWVFNDDVLGLLQANGFKWDFSFSHHAAFRNPFSWALMQRHAIRPGEAFWVRYADGTGVRFLQTLMGCHETDFPQDFVRYLRPTLSPGYTDVRGLVNSHDYSLLQHYDRTLRCLDYLAAMENVSFLGHEDLANWWPDRTLLHTDVVRVATTS